VIYYTELHNEGEFGVFLFCKIHYASCGVENKSCSGREAEAWLNFAGRYRYPLDGKRRRRKTPKYRRTTFVGFLLAKEWRKSDKTT